MTEAKETGSRASSAGTFGGGRLFGQYPFGSKVGLRTPVEGQTTDQIGSDMDRPIVVGREVSA